MAQAGMDEQPHSPVFRQYLDSKETFKSIVACKADFLKNRNFNPDDYSDINPLITSSWIRSRKFKVDPFYESIDSRLNHEAFSEKEREHQMLIETTRPLMEAFKKIALSSSYMLALIEREGILILAQGNLNSSMTALSGRAGSDWSEDVRGTNGHSLCIQSGRPVQLLGPLAYSEIFRDFIGYAAPIRDKNGEILATINFAQPITDKPWEKKFQILSSHTLGLIIAMALAIENKFQLEKSYKILSSTHKRLESTLEIIDEGIIAIDKEGQILNINEEGNRILERRKGGELPNICDYLGKKSSLISMVNSGESGSLEESIIVNNKTSDYLMNVNIIYALNTAEVDGAVLRLNHMDKINYLANSRLGQVPIYHFEDLIGKSSEFLEAIQLAKNFAQSSENILLIGESGTGKELFAQAIHNESRPQKPFIVVNCAAIPRSLLESELFGYEKGSFTGADRNGKPGKIELASGGTLFLDEIGDMPIELQAILLRVLQDKQVVRIGGQHSKKVDFRLIAATNKELNKLMNENYFREDLFYRLSVLSVQIPPLRKRKGDVDILSQYFLDAYCRKMGIEKKICSETFEVLRKYKWPGNVRQLENAIIYAINAANENIIKPGTLPASLLSDMLNENIADNEVLLDEKQGSTIRDYERRAIMEALAIKNNNVSEAASLLNIARSTLYKKIKRYNIKYK